MKFYVAVLETRSWSFEAYGLSMAAAMRTLKEAWLAHQSQTGAMAPWASMEVDVQVREVRMGEAYRDGCLLVEAEA